MEYVHSSAVIDGEYRYALMRRWNDGDRLVAWVMLNPSTADEHEDDPTIRRVVGFSEMWGFDGAFVVNLFALRATDPKELRRHPDPVGKHNDAYLLSALLGCDLVVAAWGASGDHAMRYFEVAALLERARKHGKTLWCLGRTQNGHPRHPLYRAKKAGLERYFAVVQREVLAGSSGTGRR